MRRRTKRLPTEGDRPTGLGGVVLLQLLDPRRVWVGNWRLGVGPTWAFPTNSSKWTRGAKDGPLEDENDGVVRYPSAHLEGVESEKVVRHSGHPLQERPEGIQELRRILVGHLGSGE